LRGALPNVVREVVSAIADALLGGGLVRVASAAIEALAGKSLRQLLMKWGIIKNETIECLKNIVDTAKEASQYIDDEGLRDVVEEVASKWGWDVETFKHFVKTAAGKTVKESEVEKMIEEALEKIEEELGKVRESVRGRLAGVEVFFIDDFEDGSVYPTVRLVDGELMVLGGYGYHEVVRTGFFSTLTNEVKQRLGAGSLVVLTGPKGVGKSTLATVTTWELLPDGEVVERFRSFIENFLVRDWEYFGNMIILYDPTGVYGQVGGVEAPSKLETIVRNVLEAVRRAVENARSILGREPSARVGVLIILPTDLYNALSNDVRGKLESYRLDAPLNDTEFLAGLIREYTRTSDKPSGCALSNDVLNKLASELAKFDSGHALIARLIGEELARNNCDVDRIEELISNAKGKAEAFIIQYINKLFKVHEDPDVAKALVEIFALRRPFVNITRPGIPILTPGIIKLIGEKREAKLLYSAVGEELRGWLAIRQHDLIEEAIKKILDCIVGKAEGCGELGDALEPWKTIGVMESLGKVSEVKDVGSAVKYFVKYYGGDLTGALRSFGNCWKRAAYIIGHALAGRVSVPRPEDLPSDVVGSLGDALRECGVDDYLLVDDIIPPLMWYLILTYVRVLTEAFIDRYNEAVGEVKRVCDAVRDRGISGAERFYGLGLASIIAYAAGSGKVVESGSADAALHIASFAILDVASADLIMPILSALRPLRDNTPQRYIELLAHALVLENLNPDTVGYILNELNEILDNYGNAVKGHAWSLVHAIIAYAGPLGKYFNHFNREEIESAVRKIADLLNELGRFKSSLGVIAWAYALGPALEYEDVRRLMEEALRIKVVGKANEVLGGLNKLRDEVQELMNDKEFMGYIKSKSVKANEKAVKTAILEATSYLKHTLAHYRFYNDELKEAEELFNEAAEESREIGDYKNYLTARGWVLRVDAIKGSLVGDELVKKFQQLYEETFSKEHFMPTARYLSIALHVLGDYFVSLALINDVKEIRKSLEEHLWMLNADKQASVLTRLVLNALLGSKDRKDQLGSELKDKLSVNPEELINAFRSHMHSESLPALKVALGIAKPEDVGEMCVSINDSIKGERIVCGDYAIERLRLRLVDDFRESLIERFGQLKELGVNADKLLDEFMELVNGLDGKSLVQLIAPASSRVSLAFMLYALINGDEKLARAHALIGIVEATGSKLFTKLLFETYKVCCDPNNEEFRRAIARLFFYHV